LPAPEVEDVKIQQVEKRLAAALRFNGRPTLEVVEEKKKILEQALRKDGLKLKGTFGLARYNDPGQTWSTFMVRFLYKIELSSILFRLPRVVKRLNLI
jgi:hypothetical protein